jgi:gamma-glutamylaminecyclotransferase
MPHVFVFGTLKRGRPLHKCDLDGALLLGEYRTVERFRSSLPDRGSRQ